MLLVFNLSARRMLLLAVVRPSLEYGNEVWECNKGQANALESITGYGSTLYIGIAMVFCIPPIH